MPPGRPRRDLATLELLVETLTAKLANMSLALDRVEETHATKEEARTVFVEARAAKRAALQARNLLEEHMAHAQEEWDAARIRDGALLEMMQELLLRLPSSPQEPSKKPSTETKLPEEGGST